MYFVLPNSALEDISIVLTHNCISCTILNLFMKPFYFIVLMTHSIYYVYGVLYAVCVNIGIFVVRGPHGKIAI